MANQPKHKAGDIGRFKRSLDKQNMFERAKERPARQARDQAEAEAAHSGLSELERHSKGRPKQK